jgi:hypothetical protein
VDTKCVGCPREQLKPHSASASEPGRGLSLSQQRVYPLIAIPRFLCSVGKQLNAEFAEFKREFAEENVVFSANSLL